MKKIYFLAAMLMTSGAAMSQMQTTPMMRASGATVDMIGSERPTNNIQNRAPGDVISTYEDDFASAANWNVANTSNPSGNFNINTTGSSVGDAFASTTASNGFAWYDADATGVDLGSTTDATLTYNTTMDLSANTAVAVSFESYYIDYQTQVFVEVSTDGFSTNTQYEVHQDVTDNNSSANPTNVIVNISGVAANQGAVDVRFHYTGGWGFQWSIDDFKVIEAYENELETTWAHFSSGTETNEYYAVPTDQITEITFGSLVKSNGGVAQTNTVMTAQVDGGTTFDGTSGQSITMNLDDLDTFSIETPNGWTPAGAGSYDLVISTSSDQTEQLPANNDVAYEPIVVGGDIYARDNGIVTGGFVGFTTTQGDPIAVGNTFEIFSDMTFGNIDIGITSAAGNEGQLMYGAIYKYDSGSQDFIYETQTNDYTVTATDLGTVVSLPLPANYSATTGDILLVVAGRYGDDPLFAQAQPTQDFTVLAIHSSGTIAGADPSAIVCRINKAPTTAGVEEQIAVTGLNIFPNPADKSTMLTYNVVNDADVNLTLTDLSGKIVYTENYGAQAAGQYNVDLSTAELSNGVYFYTLNVGDQKVTKKFVVQH